jgi:hypothetical protein
VIQGINMDMCCDVRDSSVYWRQLFGGNCNLTMDKPDFFISHVSPIPPRKFLESYLPNPFLAWRDESKFIRKELATGQFSNVANGSSLSEMQCSRRALP